MIMGAKRLWRDMRTVIVGYCRTPFHRAHRGELKDVRPEDLTSAVIREVVERTGIPSESIEDLMLGCAYPEGEQGTQSGSDFDLYMSGLPTYSARNDNESSMRFLDASHPYCSR